MLEIKVLISEIEVMFEKLENMKKAELNKEEWVDAEGMDTTLDIVINEMLVETKVKLLKRLKGIECMLSE